MTALDDAPPPPPADAMDSLESLRAYLWRVHKVTVGDDDPILMLHTIHKVALEETRRLLAEERQLWATVVSKSGASFVDEMRLVIGDFQKEALTDAVRERLATLQSSQELAEATQSGFARNLRSQVFLTLLNYLAVACTVGLLALVAH